MHVSPDHGSDADSTTPGLSAFGKEERQLLSEQELCAHLTALMRTCEGCENVTVLEVTRLDLVDRRDGCNWSLSLVLDPAGVAPEVYCLAYGAVIGTARESWNLR